MFCHRNHCQVLGYEDLSFHLIFSLAAAIRSFIHFQVIFLYDRIPIPSFDMWMSGCHSAACWKRCPFSAELFWDHCKYQLPGSVRLYFWTLLCFIDLRVCSLTHCLPSVANFRIRRHWSFGFTLCQNCFGFSGSLEFPYELWLVNFYQQSDRGFYLFYYQNLLYITGWPWTHDLLASVSWVLGF